MGHGRSGPTSIIGRSLPRVEGRAKVTGASIYTTQISLPGMLHARVLRSERPHARLVRVDAAAAGRLPGVHAVLTGQDLLAGWVAPHFGVMIRDQSVLAIDRVRFVGEPVAAVAAESPEIAEAALALIEVEYEELPAVLTVPEALADGAPVLHDKPVLAGRGAPRTGIRWALSEPGNVISTFRQVRGDVAAGLARAEWVVEGRYSVPTVQHAQLEQQVAIAWFAPDGTLELWDSTQHPYTVRQNLAELFGLPLAKVRVRVPMVGGGFGGKSYMKAEPLAAALAYKARRPVKWELSREEVFYMTTRHAASVTIRTGVTAAGEITAWDMHIDWDTGAYAENGPLVGRNAGVGGGGPYSFENLRIESRTVYTNKPPAGSFRGYGTPQLTFAYDQQMDAVARELGLDPVEFRLRHAVADGVVYHTGERLEGVQVSECLEAVRTALEAGGAAAAPGGAPVAPPAPAVGGVSAPASRRLVRGRGYSAMIMGTTAPTASVAEVRMEDDGSVVINAAAVEVGQGTHTVMTQIAAEVLAVDPARISLGEIVTGSTPFDRSTSASLTTFRLGRAVMLAAQDLRRRLLEVGATVLEVDPADLTCRAGGVEVTGYPDRRVGYPRLVRAAFGGTAASLVGRGDFATGYGELDVETGQGTPTPFWDTGACGCEVEVDTETGAVRLLRMVVAADVGKALNPAMCEGQLHGAAVMGLGHALFEEMRFEGGQLINPNFLDYGLITAAEVPTLETILIEHPHPVGPWGAHGVGETAISLVPPCVANAIADACGVRVRDLPITPERVLELLRRG